MDFIPVLMDLAPMPPVEPGLLAKMFAAVSAFAGGIVLGAWQLIKKIIGKKENKK